MILKTAKKNLEIQLKLSKVSRFEEENCGENENLLSLIPSKIMARDRIEFLVKFLNYFQVDNGEKLSIDEIYDFLDAYLEENKRDIISVYTDVIKEMDIRGVINKGMGFTMAEMLTTAVKNQMKELKTKMESAEMELPKMTAEELG